MKNSNNSAGKGYRPRPTNKKQYDKNYDSINWGDKKKSTAK